MRGLAISLAGLLLSGCSALHVSTVSDMDAFCQASGQVYNQEIFKVDGNKVFWLTPSGMFLSEREFNNSDSTSMASVNALLQGKDWASERQKAVRGRMYKVSSTVSNVVKCLDVLDSESKSKDRIKNFTTGRKLLVVMTGHGVTGEQIYNRSGEASFTYKFL